MHHKAYDMTLIHEMGLCRSIRSRVIDYFNKEECSRKLEDFGLRSAQSSDISLKEMETLFVRVSVLLLKSLQIQKPPFVRSWLIEPK